MGWEGTGYKARSQWSTTNVSGETSLVKGVVHVSPRHHHTHTHYALSPESDVVYPWRIPEKGLEERKMVAERRREDLLQMIYEESLTPG